ncbi:MAG TPA: class I SAM-dependent methyltransferase [Solirubrobacteraceae bacterium]|nr:class I SAM-dependent methyltransferase [Solirubrobacteraceae bacterium]
MREFYEDVWSELPGDLTPYAFARRRAFLLGGVRAGDRVLDVGCGEGAFCGELAAAGAEPVGVDVAERALARARRRHPGLRFELVGPHGPLPFPDAEFDVIWASEVIEHVADTARWLSELRRVLRSGGRLMVTTPYHGRLKTAVVALTGFESQFDPLGQHLRFYTSRSLHGLLEAFGFEDVRISAVGGVPLWRRTLLAQARRRRF